MNGNSVRHSGMRYPIGELDDYPLSRIHSGDDTFYEISFADPSPYQPGRFLLRLTEDQTAELTRILVDGTKEA